MDAPTRRLYLIRHAIAADRGPSWPDDRRRPLTKRGVKRMRQVMEGFADLDETLALVFTSPLTRAIDTATIVARGMETRPVVRVLPALAPGTPPAQVAAAVVRAAGRAERIALVGHEPDLGALAAWLIGASRPVPFKKGGICRIDVAHWPPQGRGGSGQLIWLATPAMLRR
jgi:phosphohistidine phosphatase